MNKNCLVKKLKGSVNDKSLRKIDFFRFYLGNNSYSGQKIQVQGGNMELYNGNDKVADIPNTATSYYETNIYSDVVSQIGPCEAITSMRVYGDWYFVDSLELLPNLTSLIAEKNRIYSTVKLRASDIKSDSITVFKASLYDRVENFGTDFLKTLMNNLPNLKECQIIYVDGIIPYADITGYAHSKLQKFEIWGSSHITGDIVNYVAACRGIGRTESSVVMIGRSDTAVKFNGADISALSGDTNKVEVSWTSTSITCNGTTIENSDMITPETLERKK